MGVDACVAGGTGEVLALAERNMLSVGVLVAFRETEIDDVNVVLVRVSASDQEVVRFNITMNNALFVNLLNTLDL